MLPEEMNALRRLGLTEFGEKSTRKIALVNEKMELLYGFKNENTNELVYLGIEKLEIKIASRILKEHKNEVINNCPECEGLARTPYAKQCRHCGYDWH